MRRITTLLLMLAAVTGCATVPVTPVDATPIYSAGDAQCKVGFHCSFPITKVGAATSYSDLVAVTSGAAGGPPQRITIRFLKGDTAKAIAIQGVAPGQFTLTLRPARYAKIGRGTAIGTVLAPDPTPPPPVVVVPPPVVAPPVAAPPPPEPTTKTCPDGSTVPSTDVCPVPPPPPPPVVTAPPPPAPAAVTLEGVPAIADNFDVAPLLRTLSNLPASAAPDVVGAFRFICNPGDLLADDPILYPGQPGASHLHQMYGNTGVNASSTHQTLRASGDSTCGGDGQGLAAMLNELGLAVKPEFISIYYKSRPNTDPTVSDPANPKYMGQAVPIPNGLKMIFGFDPTGVNSAPTGDAYFDCNGPTAKSAHYASIDAVVAANACPAGQGNKLGWIIDAPSCWSGKAVDSIDHRSHVAYPIIATVAGTPYKKCDANHPYVIPGFKQGAWYLVPAGADLAKWDFSCRNMTPGKPHGFCGHADYFEAWSPPVKKEWTDNCINKMLNCAAGILGDGKQIVNAWIRPWTGPRVVPVPAPMPAM